MSRPRKEEIKLISNEEILAIIQSSDTEGRYEPLGLYYCKNENGGFTAVDNSNGCAWTEDFDTEEQVMDYLLGEDEESIESQTLSDEEENKIIDDSIVDLYRIGRELKHYGFLADEEFEKIQEVIDCLRQVKDAK